MDKESGLDAFSFFMDERLNALRTEEWTEALRELTKVIDEKEYTCWCRAEQDLKDRQCHITDVQHSYKLSSVEQTHDTLAIHYILTLQRSIQQGDDSSTLLTATNRETEAESRSYSQSLTEQRVTLLKEESEGWLIYSDRLIEVPTVISRHPTSQDADYQIRNPNVRRGNYNRSKAVEYAERWWNGENPKFKAFELNCTNFVSQCLWAGGAPMKPSSDRAKGWWYRFEQPVNWSFSWSVAHSLRWYLPSSHSGLRAREVSIADELQAGDVICYDFSGDGRWQHNAIVVTHDANGMPLVNAHTSNSRHRYWDYRDSYAWTERTVYKFFRIVDQF